MSTFQTPFETLGDRRFQLFTQSLLSFEFPEMQAFPVGQSDGGRDAIDRPFPRQGKDRSFIVFQAKFVERPDHPDDVEKWVQEILRKERKNITRLVARGATKYYLVTNARGSAHPDVGGVDIGQACLDAQLSIAGQILWRTDLEVRLAKHRGLKWSYRELLTGVDVLDELVASGLSEDKERRRAAIESSLATQYKLERSVRFKQVDLQNDLIDLFVDVPIGSEHYGSSGQHLFATAKGRGRSELLGDWFIDERSRGGADVLLDQPVGPSAMRTVVLGAPGQGKSTLAQYLCQVHRIQLLKRAGDLRKLPASHRSAPTRLPFKVDLRELATFFRGEDPFAAVTGWSGLPQDWPRSLQGFLAAQVRRYSGGADFGVSDLLAVARTGPMLLVLDGLDEVAEVADRKMIVDAVSDGLAGLEQVAESVQVVVTTRPPAFANAPEFSRKDFRYMALLSLTTDLIVDYAHRWARARRLASEELKEALGILEQKLDEPHMRDLARNPMQLAILLSLINTKGESLPDKRTQLYSGYMDLYFDREASKSRVVREHRDLLYGLHGHLAWLLHVGSEKSADEGSIALGALREVVGKYLEAQGADPGLRDALFRGVVERIIALVATRQERFEFEVQPLREFFAAHHLYTTAQVSRMDTVRPGTRADRFRALARDAFWLNVARFYAGFHTSGELPSLADGLEELASDPEFGITDHPRALTAMLLSDWSFSLDRRSRERAIRVVLHDLGYRHAMETRYGEILLPRGSGRDEVVMICMRLLVEGQVGPDRRAALRTALKNHIDLDSFTDEWAATTATATGLQRTEWLRFGAMSGLASRVATSELETLIASDEDETQLGTRARIVATDSNFAAVESSVQLSRGAIEQLLHWPAECVAPSEAQHGYIGILAQVLMAGIHQFAYSATQLVDIGKRSKEMSPAPPHLAVCAEVAVLANKTRADGPLSRDGWSEIVEAVREQYGASWTSMTIAINCASAWRRQRPRKQPVDLTDGSAPLVARTFTARARSGSSAGAWWQMQFASATETEHQCLVAACAVLWMTGEALKTNLGNLAQVVDGLEDDDYARMLALVESAARMLPARKSGLSTSQRRGLSPRLALLVYTVTPAEEGAELWRQRLARYSGGEQAILRRCVQLAVGEASTAEGWRTVLRFARLTPLGPKMHYRRDVPKATASAVIEAAHHYPLWLVEAAEASLRPRTRAASRVGNVARRERWFAL